MRRWVRIGLLVLLGPWGPMAGAAQAVVFDNGLENDFAGVEPSDGLQVRDSAGGVPTTVNVLDGAYLGSTSEVSGASVLNTFAGSTFADRLSLVDDAHLHVRGGDFRVVDLLGGSDARVDGGRFDCQGSGRCMGLFDSSRVSISGGVFVGQPVIAYDSASLTVAGGSFGGGLVADRGSIDLRGGSVQSLQSTNAVFTVYGRHFAVYVDGQAQPLFRGSGVIPEFTRGTVRGTLDDGTPLADVPYLVGNNGRIVISAVPEPGGAAMLGVGLLAVLGLTRRRRR